jgi:hypothetical protein
MLRDRDYLEPRQGLRSDPSPRAQAHMPLQARANFGFSGARSPNSFKNRALRALRTVTSTTKIGHGATDKGKVKTLPK